MTELLLHYMDHALSQHASMLIHNSYFPLLLQETIKNISFHKVVPRTMVAACWNEGFHNRYANAYNDIMKHQVG